MRSYQIVKEDIGIHLVLLRINGLFIGVENNYHNRIKFCSSLDFSWINFMSLGTHTKHFTTPIKILGDE